MTIRTRLKLSTVDLSGGIEKYASDVIRKRSSSPKSQVCNNALLTAQGNDHLWMLF